LDIARWLSATPKWTVKQHLDCPKQDRLNPFHFTDDQIEGSSAMNYLPALNGYKNIP
jgi:hypothetical protein